jgi:hypothetical protein
MFSPVLFLIPYSTQSITQLTFVFSTSFPLLVYIHIELIYLTQNMIHLIFDDLNSHIYIWISLVVINRFLHFVQLEGLWLCCSKTCFLHLNCI